MERAELWELVEESEREAVRVESAVCRLPARLERQLHQARAMHRKAAVEVERLKKEAASAIAARDSAGARLQHLRASSRSRRLLMGSLSLAGPTVMWMVLGLALSLVCSWSFARLVLLGGALVALVYAVVSAHAPSSSTNE